MLFFKSRYVKELDYIVSELKNYLSNNYKDAAHTCRKQLADTAEQYYADGSITKKQYDSYMATYKYYTNLMKDYYHYTSQ